MPGASGYFGHATGEEIARRANSFLYHFARNY